MTTNILWAEIDVDLPVCSPVVSFTFGDHRTYNSSEADTFTMNTIYIPPNPLPFGCERLTFQKHKS